MQSLDRRLHKMIVNYREEQKSLTTIEEIKSHESYEKLLEEIEDINHYIKQNAMYLDMMYSFYGEKETPRKITLQLDKLYAVLKGDAITTGSIERFNSALKCVSNKILNDIAIRPLVAAVTDYLFFLKQLADKDGINEKLKKRIDAIEALEINLDSISTVDDAMTKTKEALRICLENQPTWLEKPFLEKLIDILTLGIAPLIRYVFGTEESRATEESRELDKMSSWIKMIEEEKPRPTIPNPSSSFTTRLAIANEPYNGI